MTQDVRNPSTKQPEFLSELLGASVAVFPDAAGVTPIDHLVRIGGRA
ncbi:MAG: hypothetical protein ACRDV3_15945 [Acidothermaceae bacterium]